MARSPEWAISRRSRSLGIMKIQTRIKIPSPKEFRPLIPCSLRARGENTQARQKKPKKGCEAKKLGRGTYELL